MLKMNEVRIVRSGMTGLAVLAAASFANAQGVGNPGSLPTQINMNTTISGWEVGAVGTPIPVALNPAGPVWRKKLADPIGNPFGAPVNLLPGQPYFLNEHLVVDPAGPAWTDWHEDILTPGWTWSPNTTFLVNGIPAPGLSITNNGTNLSFFFNAIGPGTTVDIHKELVYPGIPGVPPFQGFINIQEYPTPEPASVLLLGVGSLLMTRRRRKAPVSI